MKKYYSFLPATVFAAFVLLITSCQTLPEQAVDAPTVAASTELESRTFSRAREFAPAAAQEPRMLAHFINVGQGSSTLFEFPCGVVLVDTGSADDPKIEPTNTKHLMAYLADFFKRRPDLKNTFDAVVITHPHIDHTYGLPSVFAAYKVKHYIDDGIFKTGSGKKQVSDLRKLIESKGLPTTVRTVTEVELNSLPTPTGITDANIDSVSCADCDPVIRILSGGRPAPDGSYGGEAKFKNPNDNSLVVRIDFGHSSFLVTGDLEEPGIKNLLTRYAGTHMLDADVYLAGHHGSYNGTTKPLVDAISPKIAVIAVGNWMDGPRFTGDKYCTTEYGHPRTTVVQMLANAVTETRNPAADVKTFRAVRDAEPYKVVKGIYATGWDGDVVIAAKLDGTMTVNPLGRSQTLNFNAQGRARDLVLSAMTDSVVDDAPTR